MRIILLLSLLISSIAFSETHQTKIGVVLPLTGAFAEYGVAVQNGIILAQDPRSKEIMFIWEDSRSDTKAAIAGYEKLVADGATIVFVWGTTATEAIAPIAQARGVPILAQSASATVGRDKPLVLRTVGDANLIIKPLAQLLKKDGVKNIALLKAEWSYIEELSKSLHAQLPGVQFSEMSFNRTDMDFKSAVTVLKSKSHEAVGVFLGVGQVGAFFTQAAQ